MNDKKKRLYWILGGLIFAIALSVFLTATGQYLAQADVRRQEERRLIGFFITMEHLSLPRDDSASISIDWRGRVDMDALFQSGRMYASWCDELQKFYFPGLEGIPFFVPITHDEIYSAHFGNGIHGHGLNLAFSDNHVAIDFEGTIYAIPGPRAGIVAYINHVFQTADGTVFLEDRGSAFSFHGVMSEGNVMSQTLTEQTNDYKISVTVNHGVIFPPEKIVVLEMNADSQLINRTDISPFEPESVFHPHDETEYILVEIHRNIPEGMHGEPLLRNLIAQDDYGIPAFYIREDGIIERGTIRIEW